MTQSMRIVIPGLPHHVVQRGARGVDIFHSAADRTLYLQLLARFGEQYGLSFWAWGLMTNHVHLVAVPANKDSLARGIGSAHRCYARCVNAQTGARGHLFQGRFYSYPSQTDGHLLAVVRYAELNPVLAGLPCRFDQYPWTSAYYRLSGRQDPIVTANPLSELVADWRSFLEDRIQIAEDRSAIERHLSSGHPFGSDEWVSELGRMSGHRVTPKQRGRPRRGR